jgi:hypothetical protein
MPNPRRTGVLMAHSPDLRVEQPTNLELVGNLKTHRAFGLAITRSPMGPMDQVIE